MEARKCLMAKIILLLAFFVFGGLLVFSNPAFCQMTSPNYRIIANVVASGGVGASGGYTLFSTLGQSSPAGLSTSTHYSNYGGFVYSFAGISYPYPEIPRCRIGGTSYETIQSAYKSAVHGDTIKCEAMTFDEDVFVNRDIAVTLEGGYDSGFTSNTGGATTLLGTMVTSAGRITVTNFIIQK